MSVLREVYGKGGAKWPVLMIVSAACVPGVGWCLSLLVLVMVVAATAFLKRLKQEQS